MQLLTSAPDGGDEIRRFQNDEVLGDCLTCHVEELAELTESLPIVLVQRIEKLAATRIGQRFEHVIHDDRENRQLNGCMSKPFSFIPLGTRPETSYSSPMLATETKHRNRIDDLLDLIVKIKGSDLHLHEGERPKIRVNGDIQAVRDTPVTKQEMEQMIREVTGEERWRLFSEKGDLDMAYELDSESRFRCNFHKAIFGCGAVLRQIPTRILSLEQLGVPDVIRRFGYFKGGLVLVTGPTGSGKSTTLAALIDFINSTMAKHIVTIEEPIEFVHQNKLSVITQREVGEDTPSFGAALKNALRQDADVVLVGEMRDLETISLALTAAETGTLVFGTLHTNNARKTVDRMIDVFPSSQQAQVRTMLAASLRGIVAQLLLKRKGGKGRIAVNEILISNPAVAAIIREGAVEKLTDVLISGRSEGMQFMDDAIMNLLKDDIISGEEAYMKAIDKARFVEFLGNNPIAAIARDNKKGPGGPAAGGNLANRPKPKY